MVTLTGKENKSAIWVRLFLVSPVRHLDPSLSRVRFVGQCLPSRTTSVAIHGPWPDVEGEGEHAEELTHERTESCQHGGHELERRTEEQSPSGCTDEFFVDLAGK
jgi:hypothetical protein